MLLTRPVLHADETPVAMLKPGNGKTHRAYLWSYATTQYDALRAVVYDFAETRGGRHAQAFLGDWAGKLVCDDYAGYKALFADGVTEVGCMAHARRKFYDLWVNHKSQLAEEALKLYGELYDVERDLQEVDADGRHRIRQLRSRPIADALRQWLILHRQKVPDGSATAKAIDYSLNRWPALIRYLDDGTLPIDNNWVENRIRPIALGPLELAVRRIAARRPAGGRGDEPHPVGEAQRPRSLSLSQGRARATADAAEQSHRRTAAASLGAGRRRQLIRRRITRSGRRQDDFAARLQNCSRPAR